MKVQISASLAPFPNMMGTLVEKLNRELGGCCSRHSKRNRFKWKVVHPQKKPQPNLKILEGMDLERNVYVHG